MHNYFPILIQDKAGKFIRFEKANVLFAYVGIDSFKVIATNYSDKEFGICPLCGGIDFAVRCSLCSGTGKLEIQLEAENVSREKEDSDYQKYTTEFSNDEI